MERTELGAVARVVIDEVHRTTPLRLAFRLAPWFDDDAEGGSDKVYGVIHLADQMPAEDAGGPYGTSMEMTQAIYAWNNDFRCAATFEEMLAEVADFTQDIVQLGLFSLGLDPSWPPCPEHTGRHPLRPVAEAPEYLRPDRAVATSATWRCYQPIVRGNASEASYGPTAIPIGRLAVRGGLATLAD